MKLTLVGGGGIRTPLFVRSLLRRVARGSRIDRLALTDIRPERLAIMGRLTQRLITQSGLALAVDVEPELDRALAGAGAVVTTIRPGFEIGRVQDELICREAGILGQETVGAGGFAMAARSIPDLLHIAARVRAVAPGARILNFTNPSGIVTQALADQGFGEVIGICDSADNVKEYIATQFGVAPARIRSRVFGLNHLSATMQVWIDGEDVTAKLLADDAFVDRWFGIFGRELVRELGAFPNEYLFYYLLPEKAVPAVLAEPETRGQKVVRLTDRFFARANEPGALDDPDALLAFHAACLAERDATYMEYAWKETAAKQRPDHHLAEGEGYAGVALDVLEAAETGGGEIALSVPNRGAIPWLAQHDVVEITCRVDADGAHPLPPPVVPSRLEALVRQVKIFETLTVLAVLHRSKQTAEWALAAHPLVGRVDAAKKVLRRFMKAHAALGGLR
jgi:6-phospho-beta-glucosidase